MMANKINFEFEITSTEVKHSSFFLIFITKETDNNLHF